MNIVFQHDRPLPVAGYGGTERQLYWLMRDLADLGHQVTLIGHELSKVEGVRLIAAKSGDDWRALIPPSTDLVHLQYPYHEELDVPYVCTIHGNGKPGEVFPVDSIFVSRKHAENHGADAFVYNGLDLREYPFEERPTEGEAWQNFLFLAKARWKVKNLRQCKRACLHSHKHLHVVGGRSFWPPSRRIHSYGIVGGEQKLVSMQKCDALCFPVRWHEPFGIAIIEAMALGLPVLGSRYGSLPELIDEQTGYLSKTYAEFEQVVAERPRLFDRRAIRAVAENRFSIRQSALGYLEQYEKRVSGQPLNRAAPRTQFSEPAETLLPF